MAFLFQHDDPIDKLRARADQIRRLARMADDPAMALDYAGVPPGWKTISAARDGGIALATGQQFAWRLNWGSRWQ